VAMADAYKVVQQHAPHFVTFTIVDWVNIFDTPIYKDIIIDSFKYCQENKGCIIYGYVIMSNEVHAIIQSAHGKLSDLMRDLKKFTAYKIIQTITNGSDSRKDWMLKRFEFAAKATNANEIYKIWQSGFRPELINSIDYFYNKLNYIHICAIKAGIVSKGSHYRYSSASNYCENNNGLLQVALNSTLVTAMYAADTNYNFELW
jgi:REP element-mobilizing transposase RayT